MDGDASDDDDGFIMASFFTQDLDIEDEFHYSFGDNDEIKLTLGGIKREYGQTVLGSGDGTGLTIWRGAEELSKFLVGYPDLVEGQCCLELGAGLGLVGLTVAHLGARVNVITDGDHDCMQRLISNSEKNNFVETSICVPPTSSSSSGAHDNQLEVLASRTFQRDTTTEVAAALVVSSAGAEGGHEQAGAGRAQHPARPLPCELTITRLLWSDTQDIRRVAALLPPLIPPCGVSHLVSLSNDSFRGLATVGAVSSTGGGDGGSCCGSHVKAGVDDACEGGSSKSGDDDATQCSASEMAAAYPLPQQGFDLILAADVIYQEEAIVPLVATVCALLRKPTLAPMVPNPTPAPTPAPLVVETTPQTPLPPPQRATSSLELSTLSSSPKAAGASCSSRGGVEVSRDTYAGGSADYQAVNAKKYTDKSDDGDDSNGSGYSSSRSQGGRVGGKWILSFARRNVPIQRVIDEATKLGLVCRRLQDFEGSTEGIFEFTWKTT